MRRLDKNGNPNVRPCTCKKCKTAWMIDWESEINCPSCGTLHCPYCLKSCEDIKVYTTTNEFTSVEGYCPNCGETVIDYEY